MKKKVSPPLKLIEPPKGKSTKDIIKYIKSAATEATEEMAYQVSTDIERMFRDAVSQFYYSYTPRAYKRTFSTYQASSNYENMGRYKITGNNFEAGISVDPSNIQGQPYHNHWGKDRGKPMDTEWVFNRTFYEGIHGILKHDIDKLNKNRRKGFIYKRSKNSGRFLVYGRKTGKRYVRKKGYVTIKAPLAMSKKYLVYTTVRQDISFDDWIAKQAKASANRSFEDIVSIRTSPEQILKGKYKKYANRNNLYKIATHIFERYGFSLYRI